MMRSASAVFALGLAVVTAHASASAQSECDRTPARAPSADQGSRTSPYLRDVSRLMSVAYPNLTLQSSSSQLYVIDNGVPYAVTVKFDRDERAGHAAMILVYDSRHDAVMRSGRALNGISCRSSMELIIARMGESGAPTIVARAPLDDEAMAIDIRTLSVRRDFQGVVGVQLLYFAYYGAWDWFGFVGFRSEVELEGSRLVTNRLPASYLKLSKPARRQEGALGPAGVRGGSVRLTVAVMETGRYVEIEVPLVGEGSMSGAEILRRVP
jgi:hypothetical protein